MHGTFLVEDGGKCDYDLIYDNHIAKIQFFTNGGFYKNGGWIIFQKLLSGAHY